MTSFFNLDEVPWMTVTDTVRFFFLPSKWHLSHFLTFLLLLIVVVFRKMTQSRRIL